MAQVSKARLGRILTALADPTRRAIVTRLAKGSARVTDVARPFPMTLHGVSKHIRILEQAGLVHRKRQGRECILSFDGTPLEDAVAWIAAHQRVKKPRGTGKARRAGRVT